MSSHWTPSFASRWLLVICLLGGEASLRAASVQFSGYEWKVRSGEGGPGPNVWDARNVWVDGSGALHLRIAEKEGKWSCSEVTMLKRLGFGEYEFRVRGPIDQFDDNIVLGLFNYPTGDVGGDGTNEIDIEFARWGQSRNPIGNFTVWPVAKELKQTSKGFEIKLPSDQSFHRFWWGRETVRFESRERDGKGAVIQQWTFQPDPKERRISEQAMPVHINLWLFRGHIPKNREPIEIVIESFRYVPEG